MSGLYELWIGNRYVRSRSSSRFVSLISAISMLGIAIGVFVLVVVLSVVNGFEKELRERLLAMTAHASIEGLEGRIDNWNVFGDIAVGQDDFAYRDWRRRRKRRFAPTRWPIIPRKRAS